MKPLPPPLHACAVLLTGMLAGTSALAQPSGTSPDGPNIEITDTAPAFRQFNQVEITGSSIVRREQTQALPVQVISREDIRRSGLHTVAEVVQALPLMGHFVESAQLGMPAGGYSNAAIHGMPNGTLVLVNGLRLAPFGRQTVSGPERSSADLSTLPLADIERIEVLSDGASSLYGTDAIAGVVNIILRRERKGVEISVDMLRPHGGAGQGWVSSVGWGQGQLQRDGYSLLVTAEFSKRQELLGQDRPEASRARQEFVEGGQRYAVDGPYHTIFTSPAGLRERPSSSWPTGRFVNTLVQNSACASDSPPFHGRGACYRNAYPSLGMYPQEENQRLHARGEWALQGGQTVFADFLIGRSMAVQSNNWWTAARSAYGLPAGSEAFNQALQAGLDPASTRLLWMPDLPALRSASLQTNGRMTVGMRGEWQQWHYRSRAYLAQSRAVSQVDSFGRMAYDSLGMAYDGVWHNDNVMRPLDGNNPLTAQLEALRGGLKNASIGTTRLYGVQAQTSRALAEIDGKDVLLGLGMDLRTETTGFHNLAPQDLQTEPASFSGQRQVQAVHAELQIPVTASWEMNLGARSDHYSDVGRTHNAKLFSRWEINPQWSMRGSIGTGFRAPTVAQTALQERDHIWGESGNTYVLGNGNPELQPEKSTQLGWGMAFVPHRNLRLAADLWSVRIRDTIRYLSDELVLADPVRYASNYRPIPSGYSNSGEMALYLPLQNLGMSEKSGIDLEAQWRQPGDWGRWNLSAQASYLLRSRTRAANDAAYTSDLGRYDPASASVSPRLRARLMAGLTREQWTAQLILNHTSGYQDAPVTATLLSDGSTRTVTRRVPSFSTWDAQLMYAVGRQMDLRLGVRNLLNQPAPLSFAQTSVQVFGANTVYSNLWGRTLQLGMTLRF